MLSWLRRIWDNFMNNEAYFVARVRALIMLLAFGGMSFASEVEGVAGLPGLARYVRIAASIAGALAALMRAGDKTPDNVRALAASMPPVPPAPEAPTTPHGSADRRVLGGLAAAVVACALVSACPNHPTVLSRMWASLGPTAIDCAREELQVVIAQAAPDVALLLATAGQEWPTVVSQLIGDFGDAGYCALHAIGAGLNAELGVDGGPSTRNAHWAMSAPTQEDQQLARVCAHAEYAHADRPNECAGLPLRARIRGRAQVLLLNIDAHVQP